MSRGTPHRWLARRLLEPGWGGELSVDDARYIARNLASDPTLRRKWGFRKMRSFPLTSIAEKAFPEAPDKARQLMAQKLAQQ